MDDLQWREMMFALHVPTRLLFLSAQLRKMARRCTKLRRQLKQRERCPECNFTWRTSNDQR